jgi:hypothetical protein
MGHVYESLDELLAATDKTTDPFVAIKERRAEVNSEKLRRAFEQEAALLKRLRHTALPLVSDHFIEEDGQFLVMQYIRGVTLAELLQLRGVPLGWEEVLGWADELLDALEYLHAQGIIHRDIKPANIKLTQEGKIYLLDFGLAKESGQATTTMPWLTVAYAPFEQLSNTGAHEKSDLYALGATLYHLLTGNAPSLNAAQRYEQIFELEKADPLVPVCEVNKAVPQVVSDVISHAMTIHKKDRIETAMKMREALRQARAVIEEEEKRRAEERRREEAERQRLEEQRRRQEAEAARQRAEEEAARKRADEEARLSRAVAEEQRRKQETEARHREEEAEQRRREEQTRQEEVERRHERAPLQQENGGVAAATMPPFTAQASTEEELTAAPVRNPTSTPEESTFEAPDYRLFTLRQIGVATFLGSILAGGIMMAANYSNLNNTKAARRTIVYTSIGLLLTIIASVLLDTAGARSLGTSLSIGLSVGLYTLAKSVQGDDIVKHFQQGGAPASVWAAIAVVIVAIIIVLLVGFIIGATIDMFAPGLTTR